MSLTHHKIAATFSDRKRSLPKLYKRDGDWAVEGEEGVLRYGQHPVFSVRAVVARYD
jgi:hypothetical protein